MDNVTEKKLKFLFYIYISCSFLFFLYAGYDSGFCSDELDMNAYGKANIAFYTSGGKDMSFMHPDLMDGTTMSTMLKYYGSGFDYLAIFINKIINNGNGYEINVRHAVCQFFSILTLLYSGLIAFKISGTYRASILSAILLMISPQFTGLSIFDTKDVPFMAGYIASLYYIIRFAEAFPNKDWKILVFLILSLSFTLSIRIGGLILVLYLCCFSACYLCNTNKKLDRKLISQWISQVAIIVVITMIIVVLLWPFVLINPVGNLVDSIMVTQKFPQRIPLNFEGYAIDSLSLPTNYLLKWMSINIPVVILFLFIFFCCYRIIYFKRQHLFFLILTSVIVPIGFTICKNVPLYNGWRHLLFVYPSITIIAALGVNQLLLFLSNKVYQFVTCIIFFLFCIHPIKWSIKNVPHQYIYFNELSGRFCENYLMYETDYWQISVKPAIDWTIRNRKLEQREDTTVIATNAYSFMYYYLKTRYPSLKIKIVQCGFKTKNFAEWEFAVFNNLFIDPFRLENCYLDSERTIYSVNVEGMPISKVYFDSVRYDNQAIVEFEKYNFPKADSLFSKYLAVQNINPKEALSCNKLIDMIGILSVAKLGNNEPETAFDYAAVDLKFNPNSYYGNLVTGAVYASKNNKPMATQFLKQAIYVNPGDVWARDILKQLR